MSFRHSRRLQGSRCKPFSLPPVRVHTFTKRNGKSIQGKNEILLNTPVVEEKFSPRTHILKYLNSSVLTQKAFYFVPVANCRVFDWGDSRLMHQGNACTSSASPAEHTRLTLIWLPSGICFLQREGVENVLFGSVTLYWKNNGILLECFPRKCFPVLLVYFKLQIGRRVMVVVGGLSSESPRSRL